MHMRWYKTKSFPHGVHPPDEKSDVNQLPIQRFPFAPVMVIPLSQHMGKPAKPIVREGQEVIRGQLIARADGFFSVPIHAPATGAIKRIGLVPTISGQMTFGIYIEPIPGSTQEVSEGKPCLLNSATPDEIINAIQEAGIVGLGGAAFPTHVKLKIPEDKFVDTFIINGVECEPYLTTDHRVMLEQTADIVTGIHYLLKATGAKRAVIGVEANKRDAVKALQAAIPMGKPISLAVLNVKYPQGAEKMLVTTILGREVRSGGLPVDVHALVVNVATSAEIGNLLPHGQGIQERVVTITGPAIKKKGNYRIAIGTPLRFALDYVGVTDDVSRVFLGGPMMGQAVPSLDIPITKGISGITAFTEKQTGSRPDLYPCIHCGYCVDACPIFLNPCQLGLLAKKEAYETMVGQFHLIDCFECGACAYVCPAHIPLVQDFRVAKATVRKRKCA